MTGNHREISGKERFLLLTYSFYHLAAAALLGWVTWIFIADFMKKTTHDAMDYITPGFFGLLGIVFLVRIFRYLADWRDGEVLEFKGYLQHKSFGSFLTSLKFQYILQDEDGKEESYDIRFRDYIRFKPGDKLIWRISPRLKSVLSITRQSESEEKPGWKY